MKGPQRPHPDRWGEHEPCKSVAVGWMSNPWRTCRRCTKAWRKRLTKDERRQIKIARSQGRKLKELYPSYCWHNEGGRLCRKHRIEAIVVGAMRRAAEIKAMPKWATNDTIKAVYAEAKRIERATGQKMNVDHIVPLRGSNVCGLHVANNLQVLPAVENQRKGNKFVDDVGEKPAGASSCSALPE